MNGPSGGALGHRGRAGPRSGRAEPGDVQVVAVVVPVHNEEMLLPRCLGALAEARSALAVARPDVLVTTTVVLDRCTDGSSAVAASAPAVDAAPIAAGGPGAARAAGVARVSADPRVDAACEGDAARVWVACTDADSAVPDRWLAEHLAAAESGMDLLVGAVQPDPDDLDPDSLMAWWGRHQLADGHTHVFGANLGIRLSAYVDLGGFEAVPSGEDVRLVARARDRGIRWQASARSPVVTSGRAHGRADDGFASYLGECR